MNRKEQRAKRAEDFKNQKIQKAKDFNFAQHDPNTHSGDGAPHISRQEINSMKRQVKQVSGSKNNVRQNFEALKAQKDNGAAFSKNAQNIYNRMEARVGRIDDRQAAKEKAQAAQSTPPAEQPQENNAAVEPDAQQTYLPYNTNTANQEVEIKNTQEQNVNQDNDINNNVSGDDNYIVNNQDNSIRQYGGDNRSFVYNSAGGGGVETPGTMATLAGFYDVDDSPAAQAARFDLHSTLQKDAQKQFQDTSYIAQGAVKRAEQNSFINPSALDARIRARQQANRDRSNVLDNKLFGSRDEVLNWNPVKPGKEVKDPDIEGLAETYTDF